MSNIQTGAERMPHDLSHLGFLAGQIGRLITISTTPVIAGDSFRSEERRVGKECRSRWGLDNEKKNRWGGLRHLNSVHPAAGTSRSGQAERLASRSPGR